jgi:hypothetical protein
MRSIGSVSRLSKNGIFFPIVNHGQLAHMNIAISALKSLLEAEMIPFEFPEGDMRYAGVVGKALSFTHLDGAVKAFDISKFSLNNTFMMYNYIIECMELDEGIKNAIVSHQNKKFDPNTKNGIPENEESLQAIIGTALSNAKKGKVTPTVQPTPDVQTQQAKPVGNNLPQYPNSNNSIPAGLVHNSPFADNNPFAPQNLGYGALGNNPFLNQGQNPFGYISNAVFYNPFLGLNNNPFVPTPNAGPCAQSLGTASPQPPVGSGYPETPQPSDDLVYANIFLEKAKSFPLSRLPAENVIISELDQDKNRLIGLMKKYTPCSEEVCRKALTDSLMDRQDNLITKPDIEKALCYTREYNFKASERKKITDNIYKEFNSNISMHADAGSPAGRRSSGMGGRQ